MPGAAKSIKAGEAFIQIWANDEAARATLKAMQGKVKAFADDVSAMGKRVMAVGATMAAPFAASVKVFAGFKDVMSTVKAVTGATDADFARLNATAKKLGETTSFTAREAAEGMLALARAGYTVDESLAAIPGTLDLARAGALGLGEATTIMADTSRSFGLAADQAGRVGDAIAKASNISNTDIKLIGESMKHVAASASLSGQSLDTMSAALAVMANRGIKGEMAGTALRKTLIELANVKNQVKLKDVFNIDTKDARGNMRDALDIMKDLAAATAGMGNADKLSFFSEMFDTRGMTAAISLTENVAEWEKLTGVIQQSAGTASKMAAEMDNNIGGSFRLMMSAVEGVQIALGEATEGTLRDWMKAIEQTAQSVSAFVQANGTFIVGVMKIGAVMLGAGAAALVFGKAVGVIGGAIGVFSRFAGGLKALHDRLTGVTEAEKAQAAALKNNAAVTAELDAAEKKLTAEKAKRQAAVERLSEAENKAANRRAVLMAAEAKQAEAADAADQRRSEARIARLKAEAAAREAYRRQDFATEEQAKYGNRPDMRSRLEHNNQFAASGQNAAEEARKEMVAANARVVEAEKKLQHASKQTTMVRNGVARAEAVVEKERLKNGQAAQALAAAEARVGNAANVAGSAYKRVAETTDTLTKAQYRAGQITREVANSMGYAATRADGMARAFNMIGSTKVMAAAGSIAVLAGSVQMLAGESAVGEIAGTVAKIAGLGLAASSAVAGVTALKTAMAGLAGASLYAAGAVAGLAVAVVGFQAGRALRDFFTGFNASDIGKDADRANKAIIDSAKNANDAQMQLLNKRRDLSEKMEAATVSLGFLGTWGGDEARDLQIQIDAIDASLENLEEQQKANKKAAEQALATEQIEANKQAVKSLADAWGDVLKKIEDINKQRSDRKRDKDFDASIEADPYAAKNSASKGLAEAAAEEARLLEELKSKLREAGISEDSLADPNKFREAANNLAPDVLPDLAATVKKTLVDYEKAVAETDAFERYEDKAVDSVTRTREALKKLADDAKKIDLDFTKKQDNERFKDLLKTDWKSAAEEVGQAMARVNAEWIATGQKVAELQAKAEGGDIGAQRELEKALEQRKDLASERGDLEGRQKEIDSAQKTGERSFDNVRGVLNDEAKHKAKENWEKEAGKSPRAANAALDAFIADLETQLAQTGAFAEQAREAQDYAGASAYEEQVKSIQEQLSEVRGLKGQAAERETITGDFSARAIEAMMRGGGAPTIEKQQLETQQAMEEHLGKLVDLYVPPTVVAED